MRKYCSRDCADKRYDGFTKDTHPDLARHSMLMTGVKRGRRASTKVDVVRCLFKDCGKEFERPAHNMVNERTFCSQKCYHAWRVGLTKDNCEFVARIAKAAKIKCNNSEYKDLWMKSILSKVCKKPNKFETNVGLYLDYIMPGKFVYTGNYSRKFNGRSADYFSEELSTVILCNGYYWHLTVNGLKDSPENRRDVELRESKHFLDLGYDVWFIWENYNPKNVDFKIKEYNCV
jgi:hypothetical protein